MLNPNIINPKHLHSIQATLLKNRSTADEPCVTRLYQAATALFYDDVPGPDAVRDLKMWRSRIDGDKISVSSCTDKDTGLFIQLAGAPKCPPNDLVLTFGIKYCIEMKDPVRLNIATKMW